MWSLSCLLRGLLLILSTTSTEGFAQAGRRVCSAAGTPSRLSAHAESHVQPVYQPYLTTCQGQRLCSTYRTIYRVAYRQRSRQLPQPMASCCPGWSRANGHTLGCNRAVCWEPCQNGGSCAFPGRCSCPPGWTGRACQTDVDECASQSHGCSQLCINTAGSFHCACRDGFSLAADAKGCQPLVPASGTDTSSQAGASSEMKEEMKDLRSRVEALEQKLQLVLAPFHNLMLPEDVGADPISRLSHSLQQLDRIDSLSEQISFLEERLETSEAPGQSSESRKDFGPDPAQAVTVTGFGDIVHRAQARTVTCQRGESDTAECGGMKPAWGCLPKGKQQVWVTFPEVQVSLNLPG
ncbi:epidermal growth factor-like protein 7 isoform X2 [Haemorhous mexicanus]|uniref:epidermal growth factor-like protein 7 isoform X2 n=1 Tax=Haemorhous mexicanus TaxID=30427 RepID=UPI0028BE63D1|nr:epidermal growth factor-like protein 7 isoform X2 [Haemorhous mexicanus]XP_059720990.1 epidermal growth factor-like protein 7 isoform X2 [Haemorhous mexicanus]XP_059720991.1 epidermal growth factor-like protein 7 isoform X2 [Haemorhous mexicanus]XP_059720992.1 epidermal growth factor-like protein 7 isoform X2 [Haemorhous mexicanus]XP_059720993.1 epidermal growth factor-like protein 7 isoform X2 [Haemorhous mexicanus]